MSDKLNISEENCTTESSDQEKKIIALELQLKESRETIRKLLENTRWTADRHEDLVKGLAQKSEEDHLTGLANRNKMDSFLTNEIAQFERCGRPLSLVMMDLDHFKNINDTYGHPAGDEVLKFISATIKDSIRKTDLAIRYGGEEFMAILPNTSHEEAQIFAKRIKENIEQGVIKWEDKTIKITASLGVAEFKKDDTKDSLIHKTDGALYTSKTEGRNRITHIQ